MTPDAAWNNPAMIRAAFDIACDIRTLDPAEVVNPDMLRRVPIETIAGLISTLAYMVNIDEPAGQIMARLGLLDDSGRRMQPCCPVGHPSDAHGFWGGTTRTVQGCRQCQREIAARRRDAA